MHTRVVVADQSEARFYDVVDLGARNLRVVAAQVNKDLVHQSEAAIAAHLPWSDLQ